MTKEPTNNNEETLDHVVLTPGTVIDHYRIIDRLGSGGMGDVYLAEDTSLDRKVALKFLSSHLSRDEKYRERFVREAKAIAKISHANIVHIYEVSEYKDLPFYAMEFVEGGSLKDYVKGKRLELNKAIRIAIQLVEGLSEVHEAGIIHRDIKPANILIDKKGRAKISDFGIALASSEDRLTKTGAVVGSYGYMSPEQISGRPIDFRSDIFSLGVLLYELITGVQPFIKENQAATLNSVLKDTPQSISEFSDDFPENLLLIVDKVLAKKPEQRYQATSDLVSDLKKVLFELPSLERTGVTKAATPVLTRLRNYRIAFVLGVVLIIALGLLYLFNRPPIVTIAVQKRLTFFNNSFWGAVSPNGSFFAYSTQADNGKVEVWVRDIDTESAVKVFEADVHFDLNWSPDGKELLFAGVKDSLAGLFLIPSLGGQHRFYNHLLPPLPSVTWSGDGSKFAINGGNLLPKGVVIFDKKTGDTSMVSFDGPFESVRSIDWSPKSDRFVFNSVSPNALWTIDPGGGEPVKLADGILIPPCWNPKGDAVYFLEWVGDNQDLKKIRIDPNTGEPKSEAEILLSGIRCSGAAEISVSADGQKMVCTKENRWSDIWIVALDPASDNNPNASTKLSELAARHSWPAFSPDGKWLAYQILYGNGEAHLLIVSVDRQERRRITYDNPLNFSPAWSPDGSKLAFGTAYKRGDDYKVAVLDLSGGPPKVFENSLISENRTKVIWAPGEKIVYQKRGNRNLVILDPETGDETTLFAEDKEVRIQHAEFSSDGKRLAAIYDPTPTLPNSDPADSSGIWIFSIDGDNSTYAGKHDGIPVGWSSDDKWLYLLDDKTVFRLDTDNWKKDSVAILPFEILLRRASITRDGKYIACVDWNIILDIWLIENFDPATN